MFALPGILLLVLFLLGRPLDLLPELRGLPLLYLLAAVALFGFIADVRLRFTELRSPRQFGWALAFIAWCCITVVIVAPGSLVKAILTLSIVFLAYGLLAYGIRTFKAFEVVAAGLLACMLFVSVVCIHLAQQPKQCVAYWPGETRLGDLGHPDGRPCIGTGQCIEGGDEENAYSCEHAGWFGLTSVDYRVRYIGTLQDPNEVALFASAALPFAFAFYQRRRTARRAAFAALSSLLVAITVYYTQSRGGQLVLLTVAGTYVVQRYGLARVTRVALRGLPVLVLLAVLMLSGEARDDAQASTLKRLGCLWSGLEMFGSSPLFGVGFDQFTRHHEQTAHNSYVLAAAELGIVGMFLWAMTYYLAIKTVIVALQSCRSQEAEVARIWGTALSTSLVALSVGVFFLSFTYHYVLWIYFGLAGAFCGSVAAHDRRFTVPLGWRDVTLVLSGMTLILAAVFIYTSWKL